MSDIERLPFFDAHLHLQDDRLWPDWSGHWSRARQFGVAGAVCCGSEPDDWPRVETLARAGVGLLPFYGLHPWYVHSRSPQWFDDLTRRIEEGGCGVGEVGLDGRFAQAPMPDQIEVLEAQLRLAHDRSRPVSIHCLDAWETMLGVLGRYPDLSFNLHAFSSPERIDRFAQMGAYFSFNGALTREGHHRMKRALGMAPLDRILIETDAPDFPLYESGGVNRGGVNQPVNLIRIAERVSELRGIPLQELSMQLWQNSTQYLKEVGLLAKWLEEGRSGSL